MINLDDDEGSFVLLSKLGKAVWVLFNAEEGGAGAEFYRGEIKEVHLKQTTNRSYSIKHFIEFDDGDKMWFDDINTMEEEGELRWSKPPVRVKQDDEAQAPPSLEEMYHEVFAESLTETNKPNHLKPKRVKRKEPQEILEEAPKRSGKKIARVIWKEDEEHEEEDGLLEDSDDDEAYEDDGDDDDSVAREVTIEREEEDELVVQTKSRRRESGPADYKTHEFNLLDSKARKWIKKLGLQKAYGSGATGLKRLKAAQYVKPDDFDLMFHLADFLFPGNKYHFRLVLTNIKPGMRLRNKLREMKKRGEPALEWHQSRAEWLPPNKHALMFVIDALRDL